MSSAAIDALKRAAGQWPKDPLRPQLQFKELLRYVVDTSPEKVTPATVAAVKALKEDKLMNKVRVYIVISGDVERLNMALTVLVFFSTASRRR
jgi:hypothetical protein